MEKAMHCAHGVGYEEYMRHHSVRMRVEKSREKDYNLCRRMVADLDRLVHYNNRLTT
ncbi:hypothetical protein BAVI_09996 [Neobacillus vireti LMG 21834]|uniref:Uncharacterized protein n=1 Tax=Neobacillus vireti LMG 21834 TaxID=1131730 RepID=A0AB94IQ28_9BACI|nr:hypothetical protein BAVI_09996 [Neobacillus vireti LMG 21834]